MYNCWIFMFNFLYVKLDMQPCSIFSCFHLVVSFWNMNGKVFAICHVYFLLLIMIIIHFLKKIIMGLSGIWQNNEYFFFFLYPMFGVPVITSQTRQKIRQTSTPHQNASGEEWKIWSIQKSLRAKEFLKSHL